VARRASILYNLACSPAFSGGLPMSPNTSLRSSSAGQVVQFWDRTSKRFLAVARTARAATEPANLKVTFTDQGSVRSQWRILPRYKVSRAMAALPLQPLRWYLIASSAPGLTPTFGCRRFAAAAPQPTLPTHPPPALHPFARAVLVRILVSGARPIISHLFIPLWVRRFGRSATG
jgi:hypothetical protein